MKRYSTEYGEATISFSHMDRQFIVYKAGTGPVIFSVLDDQQVYHGNIAGFWKDREKDILFESRIVLNVAKMLSLNNRHVPVLIGTSIGEIVSQSKETFGKPLTWLTSGIYTDNGEKMYRRLMKESQRSESRFHGRLRVNRDSSIDFPFGVYVLTPCHNDLSSTPNVG